MPKYQLEGNFNYSVKRFNSKNNSSHTLQYAAIKLRPDILKTRFWAGILGKCMKIAKNCTNLEKLQKLKMNGKIAK